MRESPVLAETHLAFRNLGDLQFEDVERGLGPGPEGGELRRRLRRPERRRQPRHRLHQLPRAASRSCATTATRGHRVNVDLRGHALEPLRRRARRCGSRAPSGVQVRQLVLARGYMSSSEPMLHFGLGRGHASSGACRSRGRAATCRRSRTCRSTGATRSPSRPRPIRAAAGRAPAAGPVRGGGPGDRASRCASREEPVDETYVQRLLPGAPEPARARRSRSATWTATAGTTSSSAARPCDPAARPPRPGAGAVRAPATPALADGGRGRRRAAPPLRRRAATGGRTCW